MLKLTSIAAALAIAGVAVASLATPQDADALKLGAVSAGVDVGGGRVTAQIGPNVMLHVSFER